MEETSKSILGSKNVQNTLKFGLITVLALFLFIPKFMILDLIRERETQSKTVIQNVSDDWAKQQIIQGPILVIPYTTKEMIQSTAKESGFSIIRRNLIVFPKDLKIDGDLSTTKKYRSLYEVLLYKTELRAKGTFQFPKTEEININPDQFILNEAQVVMGINDLKGIEDKVIFNWVLC
jgi:inner membrane protein